MRCCLLLLLLTLCCSDAIARNAAQPVPQGRFVVLPPQVESAQWRDEAQEMQDSGTLQTLAEVLNDLVILPRDIGLRFSECEEANAFYDTEERRIELCLELMQGMAETLEGQFETEDETAEALAGAFIAVVLHEVGHALMDVLEIPVTGREEDAADQLAAWMLIESGDVESVLGAAASYYTDPDLADEDFAGEHSLDRQRYFNMVCWVYGSDPDNQQELIESWALPEHRAEQCQAEYALLDRSWTRLLSGHLRDGAASVARSPRLDVPTSTPRTPSVPDFPITERPPRDLTKPLGRVVPIERASPSTPRQQHGSFRSSE